MAQELLHAHHQIDRLVGEDELPVFRDPAHWLARQLIEKSQDTPTMAPREAGGLIRNEAALAAWRNGEKAVLYAMADPSQQDLAAFVDYRAIPLPSACRSVGRSEVPTHQVEMGLYDRFAGKGLAVPLLAATLVDYVTRKSDSMPGYGFGGLWSQVHVENKPARHIAEKLGFKEISNDKGQVTMVLSRGQLLQAIEIGANVKRHMGD